MNISAQFPVLSNYTYLNTANSGLLAKSIADWRIQHDTEFTNQASQFRLLQAEFLDEVRRNLARTFGAQSTHTYLIQNFSFGFNTFLNGLHPAHRFLMLEEDYPSVSYPVSSRGFEWNTIPIGINLEDDIEQAIQQSKPTILALSLVQYISGIKIDPAFLKKVKKCHPDLLILVDGTQFCGTAPFNFLDSGIDLLISSGYKWMMGGYGNGFAFLSEQAKASIYEDRKARPFPDLPFLKHKDYISMCFEPGHLDTLSFGTLHKGLEILESIGLPEIENTTQLLSRQAGEAFAERGLISPDLLNRPLHSSIFSLSIPAQTVRNMESANIICSARGTGTRISFFFYNTENDLNTLLKVLDA